MQFNLPDDLETLIKKRLSTGAYADAEDVLRQALEAQDAEASWSAEERRAISTQLDAGYSQALQGELVDGEQAFRELDEMKAGWRKERERKG
jgi:Arc/MetJ-type ribon-helix-helix transcriptional regulator